MLTFVKLGGSLITNKNKVGSARRSTIARLVHEIQEALQHNKDLHLILGHGSGSFGHPAAERYKTRLGVYSPKDWEGFIEVRQQADALHRIVMDELWKAKLPAISFPPSACATTRKGSKTQWDLEPFKKALEHNLIPIVFGDVVFDHNIGGTIISTEEISMYLCQNLPIQRILIAGIEEGVWKDRQHKNDIYPLLTPALFKANVENICNSHAPDVTGGMRAKVENLFYILSKDPSIKISIFSGATPDNLFNALNGAEIGTILKIK